jgi:hypothetical protein
LKRKTLLFSELRGAVAHKHHVGSPLHDGAGKARNVHHVLAGRHRTDVAQVVHDAGVEGDAAVAVRAPAQAHAAFARIRFADFHAKFHRVKGISPLLHGFEGRPGRVLSKGPGTDGEGLGCAAAFGGRQISSQQLVTR